MRCTRKPCIVSLGLAGSALIVSSIVAAMSGKHKRSPKSGDKSGDSPTAKEPKIEATVDRSEEEPALADVQPTAKEIAAAEAARARLNGDAAAAALAVEGKLPDGQEPAAVDVDYIATRDLQPLDSTTLSDQLQTAVRQLEAKDWTEAIRGLNTIRQAAAHHQDACEALLSKITPLVLKSVKSLRSSLCKTAVICVADLFWAFGDKMIPLLDNGSMTRPANSLLLQLLLKASSNDKRFVLDEVQQTLTVMAKSIDPTACLDRLLPYTAHRNPKVRAQVAIVLTASAQQMSPEGLAKYGSDRLLKVSGSLVTDNTPDARNAARELLALLRTSYDAALPSVSNDNAPTSATSTSECEKENSPAPGQGSDKQAGKISVLGQSAEHGNQADCEPGTCGQSNSWEAFCKGNLAPSAAAAVLKVSNK